MNKITGIDDYKKGTESLQRHNISQGLISYAKGLAKDVGLAVGALAFEDMIALQLKRPSVLAKAFGREKEMSLSSSLLGKLSRREKTEPITPKEALENATQSVMRFRQQHPFKFMGEKTEFPYKSMACAFVKKVQMTDRVFEAKKLEVVEGFIYSNRFVMSLRYDGDEFYMYKSSGMGGKKKVAINQFYFSAGELGPRFTKLPDVVYNCSIRDPERFDYEMQNHCHIPFFQDLANHMNHLYL